jgi:hypothetical protein
MINLIQGKEPAWNKALKSGTGVTYSGVKWIIKDVLKKTWKGAPGATPATLLFSIMDLIFTLHKEFGNHEGKAVTIKPTRFSL